jgi:hypothetical protein
MKYILTFLLALLAVAMARRSTPIPSTCTNIHKLGKPHYYIQYIPSRLWFWFSELTRTSLFSHSGWGLDDDYIPEEIDVNNEDYKTVKSVKRIVKQEKPAAAEPHQQRQCLWGVTKVSDLDAIMME